MELGSGGTTVVSQQGDERGGDPERCLPAKDGGVETPDGPIGNLPDTVLTEVLAGLGSTAEAARTSCLAKRWSCLWPDLPVMIFRGIEPDKLRELLAKPDPSLLLRRLEIHVPRQIGGLAAAEVSSLLLAAKERRPTELVFDAGGITNQRQDVPFELPFFATATSMDLRIWNRRFTLPPAGEFSSLESLTLSFCCLDPSVFLHKCPRLRKLDMGCYWMLDDVSVCSSSLEELVLKDTPLNVGSTVPRRVEIVTPMLKKVKLLSGGDRGLVITKFLAPMVENLCYKYFSIVSHSVGYRKQWHLESLTIAMEMDNKDRQVNCASNNGIHVLSLVVVANEDIDSRRHAKRSFVEEVPRLPVNNFLVLKLELKMEGRNFGSMVVHLLKILNGIQRLQLVLSRNMEPFSQNTTVVGNQDVSLTHLEEVEIEGFNVIHHDLDFLKLLLKSAPVLKILRIQLSSGVPQNGRGYKELCGLFMANASVKCFVNGGHVDREENLLLGPCI